SPAAAAPASLLSRAAPAHSFTAVLRPASPRAAPARASLLLKRLNYPGATEFGVDLSQANISIQLDVGKGGNSGSNAIAPVVEVGYEVL
ncbi:hypothetical protein SOVF_059330, partial [Spinacia oleracea]